MKTVYLIRHGASSRPSGDRFTGRQDFALSEAGAAQARAVASSLAAAGIERVVSSPLARARRTADALAAACGAPVCVDDDLTDMDCGEWTGLTLDEVKSRWPDEWRVWTESPGDAVVPGGEPVAAVAERAARAVERMRSSPCDVEAVVSHRAVLKLLVLHCLGIGPSGFWRIRLDTASVSEMRLGEAAQVVRLNCVVE